MEFLVATDTPPAILDTYSFRALSKSAMFQQLKRIFYYQMLFKHDYPHDVESISNKI